MSRRDCREPGRDEEDIPLHAVVVVRNLPKNQNHASKAEREEEVRLRQEVPVRHALPLV